MYLQDCKSDDINPADVSLELTKHFRGLRIWIPLQVFGIRAFKNCLEEKILLTQYFYHRVQEIGYKVCVKPQLSVVLFRYSCSNDSDSEQFNIEILEMVKKNGVVFLSSTRIKGIYWLRCCILSFRTHIEHIDKCLNEFQKCLMIKLNYLT
jgi:aromatic-L-amino-acid decarboxylase